MTMRRFIQSANMLNESFTGNPHLDQHIEDSLNLITDEQDREYVRDLVFIVRAAGREGTTSDEMMRELDKLHADQHVNYEDIIQQLRRYMPDIVDYHHDTNRFVFNNAYEEEPAPAPAPTQEKGQKSMDFLRDLASRAARTGQLDPRGE